MCRHISHGRMQSRSFCAAFTLMELIVVIAILAILWTIWFLSLGGYSSNARDSARVADIAGLSKSLDAAVITAGSYPTPDNYFTVTYTGGAVWYQGTFSSWALAKLGWTGIGKRPIDPLKSTEYVYSILAYWKAYQLKADYEGAITISPLRFVPEAYAAAGNPTIALVRWNYGWLSAKTQTGGMVYVLAIPSIITGSGAAPGSTLEIAANALSGTLVFHGKNLVAASSFNPNIVVFSGASLPTNDSSSLITNMMSALKTAYSGSDIASNQAVSSLLATQAAQLGNLWSSLITAQLWGTLTTPSTSSNAPTGLTMAQATRSRTFTAGWTAGSGNGWSAGCRIEYQKNDGTWSVVWSPATVNCDQTTSGLAVALPTGTWQSSASTWNGRGVRLVRVSDSSVMGTLWTLACSTTSASIGTATPDIDEDCNGNWDNSTNQLLWIKGSQIAGDDGCGIGSTIGTVNWTCSSAGATWKNQPSSSSTDVWNNGTCGWSGYGGSYQVTCTSTTVYG